MTWRQGVHTISYSGPVQTLAQVPADVMVSGETILVSQALARRTCPLALGSTVQKGLMWRVECSIHKV